MRIRERAKRGLRELTALSYRDALLGGAATPQRWSMRANIVAMSLAECKRHFAASRRLRGEAVIAIRGVAAHDEGLSIPGAVRSLKLRFDDVYGVGLPAGAAGAVVFEREHVRRIYEFVEALPADLETLIVHCKAGISRSRAVAAALRRLSGDDDLIDFIEGVPNGDVYTTLLGLPAHPAPLAAFQEARREAMRALMLARL